MKKLDCYENPSWVSHAVVYQIFPDRFKNSGRVEHQEAIDLQPWGSIPSQKGFQGGDLYGVIEVLDYLQDMGITCIYLNPIFLSSANHRYHTSDYFNVDPILGGNIALENLILNLHQRGMKIILDGVFNHCGRGFWAFNDLLENGKDSAYLNWFQVYKWPLIPYPKARQDCGYRCWWNDAALPKFNYGNVNVRKYIISVARFWIEKGIDGWRLDVPDEIPIDFWKEFRLNIKELNPDVWILGEIWGDARPWLKGDAFDGVMNYRIGWSSLSWVAGERLRETYSNPSYPLKKLDSECYLDVLDETYSWYSKDINNCQLNLLDSHDVPRALNTLREDIKALKISLLLLFLQPGAPCIYYGTERGLSGGSEPKCREAFPWDSSQNSDLENFIGSLAKMRRTLTALSEYPFAWEVEGSDVISGVLDQMNNPSLRNCRIRAFINRNRKSSFDLTSHSGKLFFSLGLFEKSKMRLGAQSAVLLSSPL